MNNDTIQLGEQRSIVSDTIDNSVAKSPLLRLAQVYSIVVLIISTTIGIVAIPTLYQAYINVASTSQSIDILNDVRLSGYAYATILITVYVLFLGFTLVGAAVLLFKLGANNLLALLTSSLLSSIVVGIATADLPQLNVAWIGISIVTATMVLFSTFCLVFLFPNGKFVPTWTKWLFPFLLLISLFSYPVVVIRGTDDRNDLFAIALLVFLGVLLLLGLGFQLYRYKYISTQTERQQAKWVLLGILADMICFLGQVTIEAVILKPFDLSTQLFLHWFSNIFFQYVPLLILLATFVISTSRYKLWAIDLVINRSLVASGVSVLLGSVFLPTIFILQTAFQTLLGGAQASTISAIIATTLVIALFNPIRRRVQRFVDWCAYGIKVDVQHMHRAKPSKTPALISAPTINKTYGTYAAIELLGRGGMGEVYKSYHPTLHYEVAIKVLPLNLSNDEQARKRFEREARTVASLQHNNIVHVFDFGETTDTCYMIMEYISGQDLAAYIRQKQKLSIDDATHILSDIGNALDYAHEQGLVHRDVKPSNVMLPKIMTTSGLSARRAVLTDFGIARIISESSELTRSDVAIGTLDYMAPEQIINPKSVDGRADIYALGIMAYQMFTGKLPFEGENPGVIVFAHLQRPAPDARDLEPDLPAQIATSIQRALEKEPSMRFQTASAFVESFTSKQLK